MKVGKPCSGVLFSNLVPEKVAAFQFKSNLRIIGINSRIKNDAFSYGGILGSREASYSYVGFAFPGIFIKQSSLAHFEENLAVGLKFRELSYACWSLWKVFLLIRCSDLWLSSRKFRSRTYSLSALECQVLIL